MYAPEGFDAETSIELGNLVSCAYDQFDCYGNGTPWRLPAKYELIAELTYGADSSSVLTKSRILDSFAPKIPALDRARKGRIPIGFVARRGSRAYVIFRGTKTAKEWIDNLNVKLCPLYLPGNGSVHEGFVGSYLAFRDQILTAGKTVKKGTSVYVAGHSLGSAFAAFALFDLETVSRVKTAALYTFGSPRIGDAAFARAFNERFSAKAFRVANTSDIVTEIPFPAPFAGLFGNYFTHADTPVVFTAQHDDVEKNHDMNTYLSALCEYKHARGAGRRFLRLFSRRAT